VGEIMSCQLTDLNFKTLVSRLIHAMLLLFLCVACLHAGSRPVAQTNAGAVMDTPEIPGWNELVDTLRDLPAEMLDRLPADLRNDPQIQQQVARIMLSAIASSAITSIGGDTVHPEFLPSIGRVMSVGQPNADTIYRTALINPAGTYRLSGTLGSTRIITISQSIQAKDGKGVPRVIDHNLNDVKTDGQGKFQLILSAERPGNYKGDWWQLNPQTSRLLMRIVSSDWNNEQEPKIAIERLDAQSTATRASAAELERRLRELPAAVNFIAKLFVGHVYKLRAEGNINTVKIVDLSGIGGLTSQYYYEGVYELDDDEALIIETSLPEQCLYRSLILTNDLYETTDWYNFHSSLNDSQSVPDADGKLRVVVSAKDPQVPNWLDTAGYPLGMIQGRWTGCTEQPTPVVRKVEFAEVRGLLPEDTPVVSAEMRQAIISKRRKALQQKSKW